MQQMEKYVLLIDDDQDFLTMLEIKLLREGFKVKSLLNGANFIDTIAVQKPDIVLIDVNMPHIAGNALCKVIKKNESTENIPVLLFSGNENIEKISTACGADGFITKPFEPESLLKEIGKYV